MKRIEKKLDRVEKNKVKFVWKCLHLLKGKTKKEVFEVDQLFNEVTKINIKDSLDLGFDDKSEFFAILADLEKNNKIMVEEDQIYLI